jgi:hypothetical protein
MSEDVSSTIRVGVTVILVAALVATVLNLMVISQSILASGQSTLQSGVDQVGLQEFENYNQKKVSGTIVKSTLSLYAARDIAIVIRTNLCQKGAPEPWAYNYGAILSGVTPADDTVNGTGIEAKINAALNQKAGESWYTHELKLTNGVPDFNANTKGVTRTGDGQFILDSARFQAALIKDGTGTIVGISFIQL